MTPLEKLQAATEAMEEMVRAGLGNCPANDCLGKYVSDYSDLVSGVPGAAEWAEEKEEACWNDVLNVLAKVSKEAAVRVLRTMPGDRAMELYLAANRGLPGITKEEALRLIKDAPGNRAMALYWVAKDGWPGITKKEAVHLIKDAPGNRAMALYLAANRGLPGITKKEAVRLIQEAPGDRTMALFWAAKNGWPEAKGENRMKSTARTKRTSIPMEHRRKPKPSPWRGITPAVCNEHHGGTKAGATTHPMKGRAFLARAFWKEKRNKNLAAIREPRWRFCAILGEKIQDARIRLDMSIERAAGLAGISPRTWKKIEAGTQCPSLWLFHSINGILENAITPNDISTMARRAKTAKGETK